MRKTLSILFAFITWFAVVTQYILMIENRAVSIFETTIRFFSFFTILTNIFVAIYFTCLSFRPNFIQKQQLLTAITIYITIVGFVYQIALRHVWRPTGMQLVVNELLHSVIPILVIIFWYLFKTKPDKYQEITICVIYPLSYLSYILIRGSFSNFYPYHFIDVTNLGILKASINAVVLLIFFILVSSIFIFVGNKLVINKASSQQRN